MDGFSFASYGPFRPGRTGLSAAGIDQSSAAPLLAAVNVFTIVPPGSGCLLPQVTASNTLEITVLNRATNPLAIYPSPGAQIENLGVNAPFLLLSGYAALFQCLDPPLAPGRYWTAVLQVGAGAPTPPTAVVSPTPPAGPSVGAMWWDTTGGTLYVWYDDGTSQQWVPATSPIGAAATYLQLSGGTVGYLGFYGTTASINSYDARIYTTGGATIAGFPSQGQQHYEAGEHLFQTYDSSINFAVGSVSNSYHYWQASGSQDPTGSGPTFRVYSDLTADVNGSISAQGKGTLYFGNGAGRFVEMDDPGVPIVNYLRFQPGGTNQGVGISVVGGDGLASGLALAAGYNGGVSAGNSNGTIAVFNDAGAVGTPRTSYLQLRGGSSAGTPTISVTTAGVGSPPASVSLTLSSKGNGAQFFTNDNGRLMTLVDPLATGSTAIASLRVTMPNTGVPMVISMTAGSSVNVDIQIASLGTGAVSFATGGGTQARVLDVPSAVRSVDIKGAVNGGSPIIVPSAGNLFLGQPGLGTTATSGFIQIPTCGGTPTGTPSNAGAGATVVYDNVANRLWIYSGSAWRSVAVA